MTVRRGDLFERLEPPPGGIGRFRARLGEPRRSGATRFAAGLVLAGAAAAAMAIGVLRPRDESEVRGLLFARADPASVLLGFAPPPPDTVVLVEGEQTHAALARVPSDNPEVIVYLAATVGR